MSKIVTPSSLRLAKQSDHLRLMLIHLVGFTLAVFVFWLIRFRPIEQNPWVLFAGISLLMIASLAWALLNYQANSVAKVETVNRRSAFAAVLLLIATILLVPVVQFRMMGSLGQALPWVAISKGFANEFAQVVLVISALSLNPRIVHAVAGTLFLGQVFLASKAWGSAGVAIERSSYANHMSSAFDPGSSYTQMFITVILYLVILALIRAYADLIARIRYVSPGSGD